jgi:hypothetical protein
MTEATLKDARLCATTTFTMTLIVINVNAVRAIHSIPWKISCSLSFI